MYLSTYLLIAIAHLLLPQSHNKACSRFHLPVRVVLYYIILAIFQWHRASTRPNAPHTLQIQRESRNQYFLADEHMRVTEIKLSNRWQPLTQTASACYSREWIWTHPSVFSLPARTGTCQVDTATGGCCATDWWETQCHIQIFGDHRRFPDGGCTILCSLRGNDWNNSAGSEHNSVR